MRFGGAMISTTRLMDRKSQQRKIRVLVAKPGLV
jgi:hypothetical protein